MLKTAEPRKGGDGIGGDKKAERGESEIDRTGMDDVEVDSGEIEVDEVGKKSRKMSKSKTLSKSRKTVGSEFLTPGAKLAFTKLRQVFLKAPILYHFNPKRHIRIETDVSGYGLGRVLSQLTSNDLGRWHPVAFFSRKIILAETRYGTHDGEILAIVEAFKTGKHYLQGTQHEVFVLTNYNNLHRFINTKSLSSRQVRWAQELSRYHFRIDHCQGKANGAIDALSQYPQQSAEEEETLQAENVKILHRLQSLLVKVSGLLVNSSHPSSLHQVPIYGTTILPQLHQF